MERIINKIIKVAFFIFISFVSGLIGGSILCSIGGVSDELDNLGMLLGYFTPTMLIIVSYILDKKSGLWR